MVRWRPDSQVNNGGRKHDFTKDCLGEKSMKPTLVVLAAGMGSRYGGIKQIEPVGPNGEIILEYSVYDAMRAGFGKVVFVLRKDIENDFRDGVLARLKTDMEIACVFQSLTDLPAGFSLPAGRTKPWGTAHAVLAAEKEIHTPFAVINADDFYGADSYAVLGEYLAGLGTNESNFAMVGYSMRNTVSDHGTVSRGICEVDAAGFLTSIVEHTKIEKTPRGIVSHVSEAGDVDCTGDETVSMNMFGFTPVLFPALATQFRQFLAKKMDDPKSEFYIPGAVNTMIQAGEVKLKVLKSMASWFGITYKEDLPLTLKSVATLVAAGEYPEALWKR